MRGGVSNAGAAGAMAKVEAPTPPIPSHPQIPLFFSLKLKNNSLRQFRRQGAEVTGWRAESALASRARFWPDSGSGLLRRGIDARVREVLKQ